MKIIDLLLGRKTQQVEKKIANKSETGDVKSQIKNILINLPVIEEENIAEYRQKMVNQSIAIHPSMFSGSTTETIDFVARMAQETESYILSCEGITRVKKAFVISSWPLNIPQVKVIEIQYEQFWNDGTSSIFSEHAMRIGEDQFEVFGSEKSAARMTAVWKE